MSEPSLDLGPSPEQIAAAAAARAAATIHDPAEVAALQFAHERDVRQHFRKMVDPGILRNNTAAQAKQVCLHHIILACNVHDYHAE